jgi:hypothetical protein
MASGDDYKFPALGWLIILGKHRLLKILILISNCYPEDEPRRAIFKAQNGEKFFSWLVLVYLKSL